MKKFELIGMKPPGKVNLPGYGTIDLETIDDTLAEKLWRDGLPYVKPTPEYRKVLFPEQKIIKQSPAPKQVKPAKPKTGPKTK
jgi:hypothetical protein